MARKKKTSVADDLMTLISMLPWWLGVTLAVVSYFALHAVAATPIGTASRPDQIGSFVVKSFYRPVAELGQYALPLFCLVGAIASAWRRRERKQLAKNVASSGAADVLDGMSWQLIGTWVVKEGLKKSLYR